MNYGTARRDITERLTWDAEVEAVCARFGFGTDGGLL